MSNTPSGSFTRRLVRLLMISYSSFRMKSSVYRGSSTSSSQTSKYRRAVSASSFSRWMMAATLKGFSDLHRVSDHTFSIFHPGSGKKEFILAALDPTCAPAGFQADQAVQVNGIYVSRHNHEVVVPPDLNREKPSKKRGGPER